MAEPVKYVWIPELWGPAPFWYKVDENGVYYTLKVAEGDYFNPTYRDLFKPDTDDGSNSSGGDSTLSVSLVPSLSVYEGESLNVLVKISSPLTEEVVISLSTSASSDSDLKIVKELRIAQGMSGENEYRNYINANNDNTTEYTENYDIRYVASGSTSGKVYESGSFEIEVKDELLALMKNGTDLAVAQVQSGVAIAETAFESGAVYHGMKGAEEFAKLSNTLKGVAAAFNFTMDTGNIYNQWKEARSNAETIADPDARAVAEYSANKIAYVQMHEMLIGIGFSATGSGVALGATAFILAATGAGVVVAPSLSTATAFAGATGGKFVYDSLLQEKVIIALGRQYETSNPPPGDAAPSAARIHFEDGSLAYDVDGNAGQAYRLYEAAFNRDPDYAGLGNWIRHLDNGSGDLNWVAQNFINSEEFATTYGTPSTVSNNEFINLLYANVLDRKPDAGGYESWNNNMNGGMSRAEVLAYFAESPENKSNVAPEIADGMWYG